jgi:hypothetical protein
MRMTDPDLVHLAHQLVSGGDSRLALDPRTGRNKYLCPPLDDPDLVSFSSCTATPISALGRRAAAEALAALSTGSLARQRAALGEQTLGVSLRLTQHFGVDDLAVALLAPSGTDATLILMGLLAAEQPGRPIVSILPGSAETGSGVPLAAAGRYFCDAHAGEPVAGFPAGCRVIPVALRRPDGRPRSTDVLQADLAAAARHAPGRPVIHAIDGSKTGLSLPLDLDASADVVVDACQARLSPARLRAHLFRDRPILITGSKFFGGPAFSGAILVPRRRLVAIDLSHLPPGLLRYLPGEGSEALFSANRGTVLRWIAALAEFDRCASLPFDDAGERIARIASLVRDRVTQLPFLAPVPMPESEELGCFGAGSIISFGVRDPEQPDRLLSMDGLRPIYRRLADAGYLVGQPVAIGEAYGALRIAIGARTLFEDRIPARLDGLFAALERSAARASAAAAE